MGCLAKGRKRDLLLSQFLMLHQRPMRRPSRRSRRDTCKTPQDDSHTAAKLQDVARHSCFVSRTKSDYPPMLVFLSWPRLLISRLVIILVGCLSR